MFWNSPLVDNPKNNGWRIPIKTVVPSYAMRELVSAIYLTSRERYLAGSREELARLEELDALQHPSPLTRAKLWVRALAWWSA